MQNRIHNMWRFGLALLVLAGVFAALSLPAGLLTVVSLVWAEETSNEPGHPQPTTADERYATDLIEYADEHRLHWSAWIYHPVWRPPLVDELRLSSDRPNRFGEIVKWGLKRNPVRREAPLTRLKVSGNQLLDADGNPILLRGVAIADPHTLKRIDDLFDERLFQRLADDWQVNLIRVPIHPAVYAKHPNYVREFLDPIVEWGRRHRFYMLLDWHAIGDPRTGRSERPDVIADLGLARRGLTEIATRYRTFGWVLFGTFNEPTYIDSWNDWRPIATELIDTVRAVHPDAVCTVSGLDWGYDLRGAIRQPIPRDNLIYECHPYPWKDQAWRRFIREIARHHPVLLGEWGFDVTGARPGP